MKLCLEKIEFEEERDEKRNRREQIEEEITSDASPEARVLRDPSIEKQQSEESDNSLPIEC